MPLAPLQPAELAPLGAWPRPQLDTPMRLMNLTYVQWGYIAVACYLWDTGSSTVANAAKHATLPWLPWAWLAFCAVLGFLSVLVRWHGLHAALVLKVILREQATPAISVWRPLPLDWHDDETDDDDDGDELDLLDEAAATPDNPLGWQDVAPLDGMARRTSRPGPSLAARTVPPEHGETGVGLPAGHG